jgi:hypothetical protein
MVECITGSGGYPASGRAADRAEVPNMTPTALDPLFTVQTPAGEYRAGLQEVLHCCQIGTLLDMPRLAAHQRAPMTELLAVFIAAARLYDTPASPAPLSADDWRAALSSARPGHHQLSLDVLPATGCAGFLQPALNIYEPCTEGDVDTLGTAARHGAKARAALDPEAGSYALVGGLHRGYGGLTHHAAARGRVLTVMVGDGSLASEVMNLAAALPARAATCLADHFLWARPWTDEEPLEALPLPVIDCRPVRLLPADDGAVTFAWRGSNGSRIADDWLDDPHVPQDVAKGAPYRLLDGRAWSHRVLHAVLLGSAEVRRPRILDRDGPCILRVSSLHHTQKGLVVAAFHEAVLTADGSLWDTARCADLSQRALDAVSAAETAVWAAATVLHGERRAARKGSTPHSDAARARVTALAGERSVQVVLQLLPRAPDAVSEQEYIEHMALDAVVAAWREQVRAQPITLATAHATSMLDRLVRSRLPTTGGYPMSAADDPRTHAVLHEIQNRFTPSQRASVRSTAADVVPYAAIAMLVAVPPGQVDSAGCRAVWLSAIRALAALRHGGLGIGTALARTRYPEPRLQALIAATGDAFVSLMDEVWRWLIAKDIGSVTMTDLVALGLADAIRNTSSVNDLRLRIALDYVRAADRLQQAA